MSPWHHIPYDRLSPELHRALTILNRRWVVVWLLTLALGVWLPLYLNSHRVDQIQQERAASILRGCKDTNFRHDETLRQLDDIIAGLPPARQAQARQGRATTALLINALVPKLDCQALATSRVTQ